MRKDKYFSWENLSIAISGHLIIVLIMIVSFVFVIDRAKLVTPDRIQITEIDLSNVKITAKDTKLFNTAAAEKQAEQKKEEKPVEDPVEKPQELKTTQMVDDKKDVPKKVAPVKRQIVRVNREVMSIDRTMTVSVVDALRVALTRCWTIDTKKSGLEDIRIVAHLTMLNTGVVHRVWFESESRAQTDPVFAYALDTIKDAIDACDPFQMLPRSEFEHWEKIQLVFYPTKGQIL